MKRISIIVPILMIFLLSSCGKKLTPQELDAAIVNTNDTLKIKGQAWITALGQAYTSRDFSALKPLREDVDSYLDRKIAEVTDIKDVAGSEAYRKEELSFLEYERNLVAKAFVPFESLPPTVTQDEITTMIANLGPVTNAEVDNINKVLKLQKEYAEKNRFEPAVSKIQ